MKILIAVVAATFFVFNVAQHEDADRQVLSRTERVERPTQEGVVVPYVDFDEEFEKQKAIDEYIAGVKRAEEERLAAEEAARVAEAEEAGRRQPIQRGNLPSTSQGPHSDAWWWGVAICEQGGRNDPYYGYFSFMDGSSGGKTWEEQVAMGNALLLRAGREIGPWAASCVAAGYRASPGG